MLSEVRGQLWPLSSRVSDFPHEAKPLPKLPLQLPPPPQQCLWLEKQLWFGGFPSAPPPPAPSPLLAG